MLKFVDFFSAYPLDVLSTVTGLMDFYYQTKPPHIIVTQYASTLILLHTIKKNCKFTSEETPPTGGKPSGEHTKTEHQRRSEQSKLNTSSTDQDL